MSGYLFRDLGQHIRDQIKIAFSKGDASNPPDLERCNRYYSSLTKISSNYYGQLYRRSLLSTASGLSKEYCNVALSPEMIDYLMEEDKGIFHKYYGKLKKIIKNDKKV